MEAPASVAVAIANPSATTNAASAATNRAGESDGRSLSPSGGVLLGEQRRNGFQAPYSRDQAVSCVGHALSALCFYVAAAGLLLKRADAGADRVFVLTVSALGVHVAAVALLLAAWRSCEAIDPARHVEEVLPNGWLGVKLSGPRWDKTRYCALCRKAVPGLDHHCTWLQTCIGKANYAQFFTIAVTGTIQFVLQVAYGVSCLLWLEFWLEADPVHSAASYAVLEAFLVACTLISVPCMFMYFVLLGFHLYLMVLGYGTYEWMLRRRKQQRAKAEARRAQAQAEAGKADPTRGSEATTHRASSDADERPVSRHTSSVGSSSDFVSVDASDSLPPSARELTPL